MKTVGETGFSRALQAECVDATGKVPGWAAIAANVSPDRSSSTAPGAP